MAKNRFPFKLPPFKVESLSASCSETIDWGLRGLERLEAIESGSLAELRACESAVTRFNRRLGLAKKLGATAAVNVATQDLKKVMAELGMQEYETATLLTDILEKEGFAVTRGLSGFPTGFLATFGSGAPVIRSEEHTSELQSH